MYSKLLVRYRALNEIGASVLLTILATLVLFALRSEENTAMISQLYLLPVGIGAARWGWRGGISSALVSFMTLNYFFLEPYYTFSIHRSQDLITLVIFLAVAAVISQLISQAQRSQSVAEAHQQETLRLYELNNVLIGLNTPEKILQALASQTLHAFEAGKVEILLEPLEDSSSVSSQSALIALAENLLPGQSLAAAPTLLVPLESGPKLVGEVRIWLSPAARAGVDQRAIQAFMLRGVMALERAQVAASEQKTRALAESDRLKSALLSSVSHELRTPLATIKASVSSLLGDYDLDGAVQTELLQAIEEETDHLTQLVSNLLSMSRLEAGSLKLQKRWNSLREIVDGVLQRMRITTHRLALDVSPDLPLLPVDYVLIEQVLINLLSNCVKYAPEGSLITLQALAQTQSPVQAGQQALHGQQELHIEIINQGPPVAEEHLGHIFDKFYRITAAEKVSGIGLGLSICKGIVEVHGGKIWAQNSPAGFSFHLTLPLTWQGEQPYLPNP